jgi:hypothetical protein
MTLAVVIHISILTTSTDFPILYWKHKGRYVSLAIIRNFSHSSKTSLETPPVGLSLS